MEEEFRFKLAKEEEKDLSQRRGGRPPFYKFLLLTSYAWLRELHFEYEIKKKNGLVRE